ncbi:MAG: hypothetical protein RR185_05045 [Angelakisella sp.]
MRKNRAKRKAIPPALVLAVKILVAAALAVLFITAILAIKPPEPTMVLRSFPLTETASVEYHLASPMVEDTACLPRRG